MADPVAAMDLSEEAERLMAMLSEVMDYVFIYTVPYFATSNRFRRWQRRKTGGIGRFFAVRSFL